VSKVTFQRREGSVILAGFVVVWLAPQPCNLMGLAVREPDGRRCMRLRSRTELPGGPSKRSWETGFEKP
jgi:hypothetical protein